MTFQTTYTYDPSIGRAGMTADAAVVRDVLSRILDGNLADFGLGVVKGDIAGRAKAPQGTSATEVYTGGATTTGTQDITSGGKLGVDLDVPRKIEAVLSSHADWDVGTIHIKGIGEDGETLDDTLTVPNNGGVTLTTTHVFRRVNEITVSAMSGTGGTFTIGAVGDYTGAIDEEFLGVVLYDASKAPKGSINSTTLADGDDLAILHKGRVYVLIDGDVNDGDQAYVRVLPGTGTVMGAFRADGDTSTALAIKGCRFAETVAVSARKFAMLELNLPSV